MPFETIEPAKSGFKIADDFFEFGGDAVTDKPVKKESRIQRQRRHYKEAGLVQINVWVPSENKAELLEDCARLRAAHLRHVGYRFEDAG